MVLDGDAATRTVGGRRGGDRGRRRGRLSLGDEGSDRDGAAERHSRGGRARGETRQRRHRSPAFCAHRHRAGLETDHYGPVLVRPKDPRPGRRQPVQRRLGRMAVGIAGPGRGHRDTRANGVHERLRGGSLAPVVGDLEQVDMWQAPGQQLWIDRLLDVAHQQEATRTHLAEQDDRHVVDAGPAVGRLDRHLAANRP
jgi:hypothetical protein